MLDELNHSRPDHIITIEDPIEFIFTPDKAIITQREIGHDSWSFANALRAAMREDPDIILV
jgi:twitching motility protein PilT